MIEGSIYALMGGNVLIALAIMWRLERSMTAYALPKKLPEISELPTVSVCIPARNERHAMTQCLERVLASTYQKLEVIVFDDSSDD
ncbi:MAG TPA: glycosyltransferase, partial [Candidatus Saccharimonadales bacterium]